MEKVLETAVNQVPSLAVLVVVVLLFLKHITKISTDFKNALSEQRHDWMEALKTRDEHAQNIALDCHQCQTKCAEQLKDNTRLLNRVEVHLVANHA